MNDFGCLIYIFVLDLHRKFICIQIYTSVFKYVINKSVILLNSLKYRISQVMLCNADIPYTWTDKSQERKRSDLDKRREVHEIKFKECGDFQDHECLDVDVLEKLLKKTHVDIDIKVNI